MSFIINNLTIEELNNIMDNAHQEVEANSRKEKEKRKQDEISRWNSLTVEQKLDELKSRLDNIVPAIQAAWMRVPLK